jgi:hypothetical protein
MIPLSFTKDSDSKIQLTFDISKTLITGDSISSITAKVYNSAGVDVSTTMVHASSFLGTDVYVTFKSGTDKADYKLELTINTTLGEIIQDTLKILVRQT